MRLKWERRFTALCFAGVVSVVCFGDARVFTGRRCARFVNVCVERVLLSDTVCPTRSCCFFYILAARVRMLIVLVSFFFFYFDWC